MAWNGGEVETHMPCDCDSVQQQRVNESNDVRKSTLRNLQVDKICAKALKYLWNLFLGEGKCAACLL